MKKVSADSQVLCGTHTAFDFISALARPEVSPVDYRSRVKVSSIRGAKAEQIDTIVIMPPEAVLVINGQMHKGKGSYRLASNPVALNKEYQFKIAVKKIVAYELRTVEVVLHPVLAGTEQTLNFTEAFR